ncbi:MAG: sulfur carrier protein ThiS [Planctomycetes bacterium]|nr:sulfur carrier protein ThiS [Planctomycetota bacterium]
MQITLNGQPRCIEAGATVSLLLAELGIKAPHVAVEVNLNLVPRAEHPRHVLRAGDAVEVVTLAGGG